MPKFEIKTIAEDDNMAMNSKSREVTIDFQILHPVSKVVLYEMTGAKISSIALNNPVGTLPIRHLYFKQIDDKISLPVYMVLIKLIWRKNDIPRFVNGVIDLKDLL